MAASATSAEALQLALELMGEDASLSGVAEGFRRRIREFLREHGPIALTRDCMPGHLTASCLLWDAAGERVLLHHHRKLDLWLQFGGHCDGDGDVRRVALRETMEESGIEPAFLTPRPVDYDIHTIPARPAKADRAAEPEHVHLDVRFLARAAEGASERISEESIALAWLTPRAALDQGLDDSLARMLALGPPAR